MNGGWLPPDHPLAAGAGAPPPPAPYHPPTPPPGPSTCPGAAPVAGWLCVNGGWLPPDHPLAAGAGVPAPPPPVPGPPPPVPVPSTCLGGAPVAGWLCVNGGWLPPDHPLAAGAPAPAPAPAPSSCTTPQPGVNVVLRQRWMGASQLAPGARWCLCGCGARARLGLYRGRWLGATQPSARRWGRRRLDASRNLDAVEQVLHPTATAHRERLEAPRLHREGLRDRQHELVPGRAHDRQARINRRPAQALRLRPVA